MLTSKALLNSALGSSASQNCPVPRGMANKNVNFFSHIHSFGTYKSYSAILNFQHPDKTCQFGKIQNSALINVFF